MKPKRSACKADLMKGGMSDEAAEKFLASDMMKGAYEEDEEMPEDEMEKSLKLIHQGQQIADLKRDLDALRAERDSLLKSVATAQDAATDAGEVLERVANYSEQMGDGILKSMENIEKNQATIAGGMASLLRAVNLLDSMAETLNKSLGQPMAPRSHTTPPLTVLDGGNKPQAPSDLQRAQDMLKSLGDKAAREGKLPDVKRLAGMERDLRDHRITPAQVLMQLAVN